MSNNYKELVAGMVDNIDLKDTRVRHELFRDMAKDLQSPKPEENQTGAAALQSWMEKGDRPSDPSLVPNAPDKDIGLLVRSGEMPVAENSKNLFEAATEQPFPGTEELRHDKEIENEDLWTAFEASGHQTGKKPGSMDEMEMEENKGRKDFPADAPEMTGPGDQTFGPSKMLEGVMSCDPGKYIEGVKETVGVAVDPSKVIDTLKDPQALMGNMQAAIEKNPAVQMIKTSMDMITGKTSPEEGLKNQLELLDKNPILHGMRGMVAGTEAVMKGDKSIEEFQKDTMEGIKNGPLKPLGEIMGFMTDKKSREAFLENPAEALTKGIGDLTKSNPAFAPIAAISSALIGDKSAMSQLLPGGANGPAGGLVASLIPGKEDAQPGGSPGEGKSKQATPEEPGKKPAPPSNDQGMHPAALAAMLAGATGYKQSRKAGVSPKDSGMVADMANDTAGEVTAGPGKEGKKPPGKDAKDGKDSPIKDGVKSVAMEVTKQVVKKAITAIPVVGPALAVAVEIGTALAGVAKGVAETGGIGAAENLSPGTAGAPSKMGGGSKGAKIGAMLQATSQKIKESNREGNTDMIGAIGKGGEQMKQDKEKKEKANEKLRNEGLAINQ